MVHESRRYSPYHAVIHPHTQQLNPPKYAESFQEHLNHGEYGRRKYKTKNRATKITTLHRGQRKLLMSEIGALLKLTPETRYTVVYAGAAPGIHIPLLSSLFPKLHFHLYDPAPFAISKSDKITIHNKYFTDETAKEYSENKVSSTPIVFICDIRRAIDENIVWEDMLAQQRWHEIMQPILTSLKFRLPWPGCGIANESNQVSYLDGEIHFPIWGPCNTTESRLVIEQSRHTGKKNYDCLVYEEEMCYFNRNVRPSIHAWQDLRVGGLDGCYDCTAEVNIIGKYCAIYKHIELTSSLITKEIKRGL